jgi:hypothetical protein
VSAQPKEFTKRQKLETLRAQLELERSSFITHWRDCGDYILPRRPRFTVTDRNRGDRRNRNIIDSTGTLAARTLRSGMMSGITSPARPWFRLTTPDPDLAEYGSVKDWLHFVSQRMSTVFLRSNLYNVLPIVYGDLGVFGTAAVMIEEDFEDVIRFCPFPIGSYLIANNDRLKVDVFFREFGMTVRQLVQRFGRRTADGGYDWSNFSDHVRTMWDRGEYETWIDVCHAIYPNDEYDPKRLQSKHKRYASCYYEKGTSGGSQTSYTGTEPERYLRESGYDFFPVFCPRWEVTGEDVYGTSCPGMDALGDIKALQTMQRRLAQAIEKMVNPPMVGPTALRNTKATILPGDITFSDEREGQKGFRPAHEVDPRIQELVLAIQDHQQRVRRALFEDLMLLTSMSNRREVTAREIEERHEEKLLALGPVLEQLNQDLLDPVIDATFNIMVRQRLIPPAPKELQGIPLKVEYLSIMAQAQKYIGISGIERFAGFAAQVIEANPAAADKVDTDQMLDVYGDMTSVPPGIIRTDEQVAGIRGERDKAVRAQQAAELAKHSAGAVKDLSQSVTTGDNALSKMIESAQAGALVEQ